MLEDIFNLMTTEEKASYTWKYGTFLATRTMGVFTINLYFVDDFYTEIYFNRKKNEIGWINSFKDDRCFEPYLEVIELGI